MKVIMYRMPSNDDLYGIQCLNHNAILLNGIANASKGEGNYNYYLRGGFSEILVKIIRLGSRNKRDAKIQILIDGKPKIIVNASQIIDSKTYSFEI